MTGPTPAQIRAISDYLNAIDRCMTDEGIDGHTRRRVRNRFLFGDPAGDPYAQIPELVGPLRRLGTPYIEAAICGQYWPGEQETAGMPPEPASNEPTRPDEGPTTPDPLGDALRATGISIEELTALHDHYAAPPGIRLAEAIDAWSQTGYGIPAGHAPDATQQTAALPDATGTFTSEHIDGHAATDTPGGDTP